MRPVVLALAAVLLAGCGGVAAGDTEEQVRIGFVPKSLNQEFWVNTDKGAQAAATGDVEVITQPRARTSRSWSRSTSSRTCSSRIWMLS